MTVYTKNAVRSVFKKFSALKVFVVGDAMLDNYWVGNIDRISPEAPVPVVCVHQKESRLGGAANVALNCRALGAEVYLLTVTGKDSAGNSMLDQLKTQQIQTNFCIQSKERITTTKTRVLAKNQQVLRIDEETTDELSTREQHHFIDVCLRAIQIEKPDILIFEDYNKGVLSPNIIEKIIAHCKVVGVMTAVDPKLKNFFSYIHVDLFKPNLKEVREACHTTLPEVSLKTLKEVHKNLNKQIHHEATMVTLSEKGIFVQSGTKAHLLPAYIRTIADVSGAGDTVIAVASMVYCISRDLFLTAYLANLAGGIVCEELGVVPISKEKLQSEVLEKLVKGNLKNL